MNVVDKKTKVTIGTIFIALGAVLYGMGGYVFMNPLKDPDENAIKAKLFQACKKESENYDYVVTNRNGSFEIMNYSLENWDNDLAGFSMISTNCNGFTIKKFCMGQSCPTDSGQNITGTVMKIEYDGKMKNNLR